MRGAGSQRILGCAGKFLESLEASRAHLLSLSLERAAGLRVENALTSSPNPARQECAHAWFKTLSIRDSCVPSRCLDRIGRLQSPHRTPKAAYAHFAVARAQ